MPVQGKGCDAEKAKGMARGRDLKISTAYIKREITRHIHTDAIMENFTGDWVTTRKLDNFKISYLGYTKSLSA